MNNLWCEQNHYFQRKYPSFEPLDIFKLFATRFILILQLFTLFLHLCNSVRFISFSTNLTLNRKKNDTSKLPQFVTLIFLLVGLFSAESPENYFPILIILPDLNCRNMFSLVFKFRKALFQIFFTILSTYMFYLSTTHALLVFQTWCDSLTRNSSPWLQILLIALSNDFHQHPGPPFHNSFFTFMSWNVNSIAKDNFQRVRLIEAHNSIFNYDLISICETSLNDSIKLPDILLNDYTFVSSQNPTNTRHGGVRLFFKNSLPIKIRNDLSFEESTMVELNFDRKKSSLRCYIEALPLIMLLLSSWTSCQMLPTYIPKLRMKIRMYHSLLETLMDILSFGGLMVTQRLKVGKLKIF